MASVPTHSLNINVSDAAVEFIQAMVAAGTCADASDLVQQLIDEKQRELDDEWLDAEILKGLNSGPGIEITPEYWERKNRELTEWHQRNHPS